MRRHIALALLIVAGAATFSLMIGGVVSGQQAGTREMVDLRTGIYQENTFAEIPHALPAYVAGFCALVLGGYLLGFYEMGAVSILGLLAAIGGIIYKFYWPLWH
ncbi:MAG TPA: hypothetical protein VHM88_04105 [Candidatus Acidoferrales bacterium]|nr:hypothetical protein [Candidatus Acidoferrales bacterium]